MKDDSLAQKPFDQPVKRDTPKPVDPANTWRPMRDKPGFEVNGKGQLRTTAKALPASMGDAFCGDFGDCSYSAE